MGTTKHYLPEYDLNFVFSEKIKKVNDTLQLHVDKRQYLHATDLLIKSGKLVVLIATGNVCGFNTFV